MYLKKVRLPADFGVAMVSSVAACGHPAFDSSLGHLSQRSFCVVLLTVGHLVYLKV